MYIMTIHENAFFIEYGSVPLKKQGYTIYMILAFTLAIMS